LCFAVPLIKLDIFGMGKRDDCEYILLFWSWIKWKERFVDVVPVLQEPDHTGWVTWQVPSTQLSVGR